LRGEFVKVRGVEPATLAVRRMLPKLLGVVMGRDLLENWELSKAPSVAYRSRNAGRPDSEGARDDSGVEDVDLKCSVFAVSITSYSSEMRMFLEDARE
jgi:hypothetical protein